MGIDSVRFRGRHVSVRGVIFLVTGSLSLLLIPVLSVIAMKLGHSTVALGVTGIAAAVFSAVGLVFSVMVFMRERDIYLAVPIAGTVVNGISLMIYVIIWFLGMA